MRHPLNTMTVVPEGQFKAVRTDGTGLLDSNGVRRHIGVDLRASVGTPFYAPGDGVVTLSYTHPKTGLQVIEARIDGKLHRFLHLSKRDVAIWQTFKEGQQLGLTGNSGNVLAHLHWDVRKDGTTYNASLSNYEDPMKLKKGNDMYPNKGDIVNQHNATGWPGHPLNDADYAYWTTGTNNPKWPKGADHVWAALCKEVAKYVQKTYRKA